MGPEFSFNVQQHYLLVQRDLQLKTPAEEVRTCPASQRNKINQQI